MNPELVVSSFTFRPHVWMGSGWTASGKGMELSKNFHPSKAHGMESLGGLSHVTRRIHLCEKRVMRACAYAPWESVHCAAFFLLKYRYEITTNLLDRVVGRHEC